MTSKQTHPQKTDEQALKAARVRGFAKPNRRNYSDTEPVQVIAVASGKGGVGKTSVAVNLATALANRGRRVMLLDGDAGLADINIALGLHPLRDLSDVLRGRCSIDDILVEGPSGVMVVPACADSHNLTELGERESAGLIGAFSQMASPPQVLIVDTAAGIGTQTLCYVQAAGEVLVVLGDDPAAVRNAYSLIEALSRSTRCFRVLALRVDAVRGQELFEELQRYVDHDLNAALHFVGVIPEDVAMRRALERGQPVVNSFPQSPATRAFKQLARRTETWAPPTFHEGGVAFFVERLIHRESELVKQVVA